MGYLYLINFAIYQVIGLTLLLVWRRYPHQGFARNMGYSTLGASLVALGYMAYQGDVAALRWPGMALMIVGVVLNHLYLCYGVAELAGRRLPRSVAVGLTLLTLFVMAVPVAVSRLAFWSVCNMALYLALGALATRWLWRTAERERLVGLLLVLQGVNQLWLIVLAEDGLAPHVFGATVLRLMIGGVFIHAALERAARDTAKLAARFEMLTEHSVQGLVVTDGERILYANPAVRKIYGMPVGQGSYAAFADLPPATFNAELFVRYHAALQAQTLAIANWEGQRVVAGGRVLDLRFEAWRVEWDGVPATQVLITDDTERHASARALHHQSTHDKLTDLPNRSVLMQRLQGYCTADGQARCALVVLNIDRFKQFNQSQGQVAGDQVLVAFAARLREVVGDHAELMRLAGDEFAIIAPDGNQAQQGEALADRLRGACARALVVPGGEYYIDASMGMAVFPDNAGNAEGMLRAASAAMYLAKRTPGTALAMAEQSQAQVSATALENEQALRKGIRHQEFYLDYQPKVDAVTGRLVGFEALARWHRPGVGLVSPVEFIAIAERTGLIHALGAMLLERACRQIVAWRSDIGDCVPVAVNVSPIQLLNRGFPQVVERVLDSSGVPPQDLTLEITESAAIDKLDDTRQQLQQLRQLGIRVAMDDFGTGFSSLGMLRTLPLNTLKIDRSLIDPLPAPDAVAVVTAICQLAAALEMTVVAEGIETAAHEAAARAAGCQVLQGYYFARPLGLHEAGAWLKREMAARGTGVLVA